MFWIFFAGSHPIVPRAEAYCLSCSVAQTKASCGELRQCQWSTKDEAAARRIAVLDEVGLHQYPDHLLHAEPPAVEEAYRLSYRYSMVLQ